MSVSVAIVGTGPAGFYTAEALLRQGIDCTIDLIDRLPTPYGLIRFGVAPDHQTTKKVARNLEKTALNERCRFFGNVTLGRDLTLDELRGMYDAVVLAVGADNDRRLGIPGVGFVRLFGARDYSMRIWLDPDKMARLGVTDSTRAAR